MKSFVLASLLAALAGSPLMAAATHHASIAGMALVDAELSEGEVRRVDKDAKKITIKHGPLANLDMPPMTMVFQVSEPSMLDQVKPGDKVRFLAEKLGGAYTVMRIAPQP